MDDTSQWTLDAIRNLIDIGVSLERIADQLDIDVETIKQVECPVIQKYSTTSHVPVVEGGGALLQKPL